MPLRKQAELRHVVEVIRESFEEAISTRRKAARHEVSVELSKAQRRWLKDAVARSGAAVDEGAVLRALVDLGAELEIDWAAVTKGRELREAVREAVMVRRRPAAE